MRTPPKPPTKRTTPRKTPAAKKCVSRNGTKKKARELNVRQERFCELIAAGEVPADAWINAGYKVSREVARRNAHEALTYPDVKARIALLRKPQTKTALRKKEDNLRFLAEVIGTALRDIGPDSPLCMEYSEDFIAGGARGKLRRGNAPEGNEVAGADVIRRRVKKPDPLRAIELYSKLLGHFEPDRVEVEAGPKTLLSIKERAAQVASALGRRPGCSPTDNPPATTTGGGVQG